MSYEVEQYTKEFFDEVIKYCIFTFRKVGKVTLIMDWSERARSWCSYKDGYRIKIAMQKYYRPTISDNDLMEYVEYQSFTKDPIIGGFATNDWRISIRAIVCHEIAHIFDLDDQHGDKWKEVYAKLRQKFVNPYVDHSLKISTRLNEQDRLQYEKYCEKYNLKKEWYGLVFGPAHDQFRIIGWMPAARKYLVKVERLSSNKMHAFKPQDVITGFKLYNVSAGY